MNSLTLEEAKKIAHKYLVELEQELGEPLGLADAETLEKPFGWVFFYNSKDYLETGDFMSMLGGNAPFIVNKNSGDLFITGTANPIEDYIAEYEQQYSQP